ncbi:SusC/RagA family TonB-linked outer membrane protein [Robertkochia solimangrovi]|uniref:SusC/RagA family TonB-linked outer membrane protein n=1 Tax=Robertkochia solimangrovi TaxID=2213046 RepID=UPI00117F163F|nr:TonB-dependent receptor [Robertkochia solimangrovi]TRZ44345.1 SusC/RagA family TonB-linked outer membrane protein [Robertkochia solimangrovi]
MNSLTIKQFIKLTFQTFCFLIILSLLNPVIAAEARGQRLENYKIDLSVKNSGVVEVLKQIEEQTGFKFVYDRKVERTGKNYSMDYQDVSLRSVLELMAREDNLTFKRINQTISIDVKPKAPILVVEVFFETVTGTVTDETGVPLAGASVREKGTMNGTTTDFDGNFTLDVEAGATIEISYIGYLTSEVKIQGSEQINVKLVPDQTQLEDVVVVGYGTQKKSDITGSIGSVTSDNFNKGLVSNPGQLLQGKIAGVNVSVVSGEPGATQDVIIRGVGSMRAGTTPLYVIDGFALDNSDTGVATNPLNFINPEDIASIDVLKDASATAIYGARAANGVIVITTKKGKTDLAQMNVSFTSGFSTLSNKVDVFSADEFRRQVAAAGGTLEDGGADTDWQDVLTRTAYSQNINFSMSNAGENFSYRASVAVNDQEGILRGNDLKLYSGRLNMNQTAFNKHLSIDYNLAATRVENSRVASGSMVSNMLQLNPTTPVYTDGEPTLLDNMLNPMTREEIYSDEAVNNRILANIAPSVEFIKGLTYKLNLGVDYSTTERDVQTKPYPLLEDYVNGSLNSIYTTNKNFLVENTLTYNWVAERHNLTVLAGHTYQETFVHQKNFSMEGFSDNGVDPKYQDQVSGESTPTYMNTFAVRNELQSFFGRVNYVLDNKYMVTATMRADGSSKFGENNRYGYFPSVALGWNIMNEDFISDSDWINNLKLRASWGKTGNQEIPSKITKLSYTDSKTGNDTYPLDGTESTIDDYPYGTIFTRLANPDIQWEVSAQTNIGLDFGLFNNRLTGTIDYFNKVSENILLEVTPADPIQPTDKYWTNIPDMEIKNSGLEFTLDYRGNFSDNFTYNIGGNISYTRNEVVDSPYAVLTTGAAQGAGQTDATINGNINGEPIGSFYMQEFLGIGDDGLSILSDDRMIVGSALPDVIYAFYLNMGYKNFDLSLNFNGVSGNKVYNHTAMSLFTKGQLVSNFNTSDITVQYPEEDITNSNTVSTRYLENGAFLRLNNASLGYNLKPELIGLGDVMSNIRLSVTGQNLFVITDYTGYDPEINSNLSMDGIQTFGIDYFNYPKSRTVLFGLNASF